jgi:carboxyl-terminal processing protease
MTRRLFGVFAVAAAVAAGVAARDLGARALQGRAVDLDTFDLVWTTVRDQHFDLSRVDWDAVRRELRPRVEAASGAADARAVMRDMLGRLGQSHFGIMSRGDLDEGPAGPATLPFDVRVADAGVVVIAVWPQSSAERAGLRPGDRLVAIDGAAVDVPPSSSSARDEYGRWRRATRAFSGVTGSRVIVTWRRPAGTESSGTVERTMVPGEPVTFGNLPLIPTRVLVEERRTPGGRRVGVIAFNIWMPAIAEPFADAVDRFRATDGLVIDLRGNPGGLADMIRGIAGHLIDEPAVLGRMQMRTNLLEFRVNPRRVMSDGRRVTPFSGPVALIVDELTASASECFAGALQSLGRARVFGTTSTGQALPARTLNLPNGDVLMFAVGDFVTSTGQRLEGVGVVPDEAVPLVPGELAAGRDAVARAVAWIDRAPAR